MAAGRRSGPVDLLLHHCPGKSTKPARAPVYAVAVFDESPDDVNVGVLHIGAELWRIADNAGQQKSVRLKAMSLPYFP